MKMTPMLQQYLDVKRRFPDAILFFRMGDFYEMFFEDAVLVSKEVGLTLTSRNKGSADEVPMAGMPHHSHSGYVSQLIAKGYTVAICDQIEDPAQAKGIVKRDVVRVVTPGVVLDADNLDERAPNYFAGVMARGAKESGPAFGLASVDISTGDFRVTELGSVDELAGELLRLEARELLVLDAEQDWLNAMRPQLSNTFIRVKPAHYFAWAELAQRIDDGVRIDQELRADCYYLNAADLEALSGALEGFALDAPQLVKGAAAAVLSYLVDTRRGVPANVGRVVAYRSNSFLVIDESTKANLELTQTLMGAKRSGSLLGVIDRTATAMGARRLRNWLSYPLVDVRAIERRLDAVEELVKTPALRQDLRGGLEAVYDIERLCGRISAASANARDLRSLQSTLAVLPAIKERLGGSQSALLLQLEAALDPCTELCALIERALVDDPPSALTEGGLFKRGFHPELDELIELSSNGKDWMLRFEAREKARAGISSLKVKYNRVFGYYIEITRANLDAVPDDYIRKQTLANAERYFTPELKEMEERILGADDQRTQLEYQLFEELRKEVGKHTARLLQTATSLADLDVVGGLAELAHRQDYCRPVVNDAERIHIVEGRHPVVESTLVGERFVGNSVDFDAKSSRLLIITGPNMAGKSTVIRQVALIALMAQMGSFVPAQSATIGVVDKIFSRVGASDNLARGHSTFMVEMTETAHILNNATAKSLIILDEIGRGTSTFDGLSIAWSVAEYLHDEIGAKTMFATHYHELTELVRTLDGARNLSIAVKEWNDDIIFLRKLVEGQANRSYGIQVGRLAGLPEAVVKRAKGVLENLEAGQFDDMGVPRPGRRAGDHARVTRHNNPNQLSLFNAGASAHAPEEDEVLERLRHLDVNTLTPLEALNLLGQLARALEPK
ncbi:MAG: DNA mismatch repair protein MutS [Bradymonadaceae bacterium]|nr:DNA mismatch repair protein MutS [Lujinxingiaceae bacterium]